MSIAISAIIKPSRILDALIGSLACSVLATGAVISAGMVGELSLVSRSLIGACSVFIALSVFYQRTRNRSEFHVHISGLGQIRIAKLRDQSDGMMNNSPLPPVGAQVRLLPASTIWPWLLLLRLQPEGQPMIVIPIMPDCVSDDTFRALSVACRWLAAHDHALKH